MLDTVMRKVAAAAQQAAMSQFGATNQMPATNAPAVRRSAAPTVPPPMDPRAGARETMAVESYGTPTQRMNTGATLPVPS